MGLGTSSITYFALSLSLFVHCFLSTDWWWWRWPEERHTVVGNLCTGDSDVHGSEKQQKTQGGTPQGTSLKPVFIGLHFEHILFYYEIHGFDLNIFYWSKTKGLGTSSWNLELPLLNSFIETSCIVLHFKHILFYYEIHSLNILGKIFKVEI